MLSPEAVSAGAAKAAEWLTFSPSRHSHRRRMLHKHTLQSDALLPSHLQEHADGGLQNALLHYQIWKYH